MNTATLRAKSATQDRSRKTRDSILSAMDRLLEKQEMADITISDLAKAARVSPATIHQRFSNKDATLSVLIELFIQRSFEWSRAEAGRIDWRNATSLEDALLSLGRSAWHQVQALRHIMRPAYLYSRLRPDILQDQWAAAEASMVEGFKAMLASFPEAGAGKGLNASAIAIGRLYNMLTLSLLLHDDTQQRGREAFARELADFALGYLDRRNARSARFRKRPAR